MGIRRTSARLAAWTLAYLIPGSTGLADPGHSMTMCFTDTPRQHGTVGGFRNYVFNARVHGAGSPDSDGYWIVAMDEGKAGWVQLSTGIREHGPNVDMDVSFGVENGSSYPLHYVVLKADREGKFSYSEIMKLARVPTPFDMTQGDVAAHVVSSMDACAVTLKDEVPEIPQGCFCPR